VAASEDGSRPETAERRRRERKASWSSTRPGDELDSTAARLSRDWQDPTFKRGARPSRQRLDEEGDKKHDAMQNMHRPHRQSI